MRVAFNGYFLEHPSTGSGQYLRHLTAAMRDLSPGDSFDVLERPARYRFGGRPGKVLWEQIGFPDAARRRKAGIVHVPYFAPPVSGCEVVTIHDVIGLLFPEYAASLWTRLYQRLVAAGAGRARAIITDSQSSAVDVVRLLRVPRERVRAIHLGADPGLAAAAAAGADRVRRDYEFPERFVLYFGSGDVRKNLEVLLQAWFLTPEHERIPLILAGDIPCLGTRLFPDYRRLASGLGIEPWVRFLGRIPEHDKAGLMGTASVLAFPSRYEGFGLEPLEAMACGTPVVCSTASSLPAVTGGAAILADPDEPSAWAEAIGRVLSDPAESRRLREAGLDRAARLTWRSTAEATLAVYRELQCES